MHKSGIALLLAFTLLIVACESGRGPKETGGALVGAVVGGLLGSKIGGGSGQLATTAVGTLFGAYLGSQAGQSLDRADRVYAERAAQKGLESKRSGTSSTWVNPDTGHAGAVKPLNTYRSADGLHCRDYEQTITVDGHAEIARGTACREADGSWRIVNGG